MANPEPPRLFGLPDETYISRKSLPDGAGGLLTKREVRAISLARLELTATSIVWDIGAGSGAVAIEAARLCQGGQVWTVEKNHQDLEICRENIERADVTNLRLVAGLAPAACQDWPAPDSVFIGGSGGQLPRIIELISRALRPGGRLVLNLATLENLQESLTELAKHGFESDVTLVQISRSKSLLNLTRLEALNPVFVVSARRAKTGEESE